jgi:hypothetical protein
MSDWKAGPALLIVFTLACGGGGDGEPPSDEAGAPDMSSASTADLPDPCALVTDEEISEYLWQGMEANQRESLQARNAKHIITKRVEDVANPASRTCYFQYQRVAGDTVWGEGDFQLRTLARGTFEMFAESSPSSQDPLPGVGDQAFVLSNAAYVRRGDVGVEKVSFSSEPYEIEFLKRAVARLP